MKPQTRPETLAMPRHVAIVMDGNGRWAAKRHLPRQAGHRAGIDAVRRVVRAASDMGIKYLTLFGFSSENWKRPPTEINALMDLMRLFIRREVAEMHKNGVRLTFVGAREGLPSDIRELIEESQDKTQGNTGLGLRIAFNYGGQQEIAAAVQRLIEDAAAGKIDLGTAGEEAITERTWSAGTPDPELVIRTSGEQRLSNFLLWQASRSQLIFIDKLWPDFGGADLQAAVNTYRSRLKALAPA